eukprot:GEMP01079742.1.p1 GENE.GEMP01079742.1~~GEMP01079742.1.p1  ORF type:complete len:294 (+),score=44.00 GEMP01079742.1:52-933(+)
MERWLRSKRILTVGDGDFSFSNSLLDLDPKELCATCYDGENTVCAKYASARSSIDAIRAHHQCLCGVDATQLPAEVTSRQFDRVIFQFPLVPPVTKDAWKTGVDVALLNRELLLGFLKQVEPLLAHDGLVMITSKDVKPYLTWRIEWALSPHTNSLKYLGKLPFNPDAFSQYKFQNVQRDQKVKCTMAYTYLYGWNAPNDPELIPPVSVLSTALYCDVCPAGPFSGKGDMALDKKRGRARNTLTYGCLGSTTFYVHTRYTPCHRGGGVPPRDAPPTVGLFCAETTKKNKAQHK